jgi:alpha-acetolactate decarboxylase
MTPSFGYRHRTFWFRASRNGLSPPKLRCSHGGFGLGTFENPDGEIVVLEGAICQVRSDGTVTHVVDDVGAPFAVVVPFVADHDEAIANSKNLRDLTGTVHFATPPSNPKECVFALTTQTLSADLKTKIVPCQFGGNPHCGSCGCLHP